VTGVWLENGIVALRHDLPYPSAAEGEAVIKILCAGICSTDHSLIAGMMSYVGVLGHEFVGLVEEGPKELLNKRVVGEIVAACRQCATCKQGRTSHCPYRTVLGITNRNGVFAEYITLPVKNLYLLPDSIPTEIATFTEPLAAAVQILKQVEIEYDNKVLVVGSGKLAQLIARVLLLKGCNLHCTGRNPRTLAIFPKNAKACHVDDMYANDFDVVVECTGNAAGFDVARRALRPRGTLVLKSTYPGTFAVDLTRLVVDEITVVGSRCGPFSSAIELLALGNIDLDILIDQRFQLNQAMNALRMSQNPGILKVLLDMQ